MYFQPLYDIHSSKSAEQAAPVLKLLHEMDCQCHQYTSVIFGSCKSLTPQQRHMAAMPRCAAGRTLE